MRIPVWLLSVFAAAVFTAVGWAITDRIAIGERVSVYSGAVQQIIERLGRIENKVDSILLEQSNVNNRQRKSRTSEEARPTK